MMIKKVICICCFLMCLTLSSQEKVNTKITQEVPISIFTLDVVERNQLVYKESSNDVLKLKQFKFLYINQEHIRNGVFNVDARNIGRKASNLSYESYRNLDLYKYIPRPYDLRTIPWRQL